MKRSVPDDPRHRAGTTPKRRAAFLDRDGTVIVERQGFLVAPHQIRLINGAGEAIRALNDAGLAVVILTNQSAVARGLLDEATLGRIHSELRRRLRRQGARVDAIYYCPHHPSEGRGQYLRDCQCRKPRRGMLKRATRELGLTLRGSFLVGDDLRDLLLTENSPIRPVLVTTGKGGAARAEAERRLGRRLSVQPNLLAAVSAQLESHGR